MKTRLAKGDVQAWRAATPWLEQQPSVRVPGRKTLVTLVPDNGLISTLYTNDS